MCQTARTIVVNQGLAFVQNVAAAQFDLFVCQAERWAKSTPGSPC